jgi:kynureninase
MLRLGIAPLYLSYRQVWDAMEILREILENEDYSDPAFARDASAAVT